ncbi:hypothetical protein ACS0TY_009335 [Phlomoides rotata]
MIRIGKMGIRTRLPCLKAAAVVVVEEEPPGNVEPLILVNLCRLAETWVPPLAGELSREDGRDER